MAKTINRTGELLFGDYQLRTARGGHHGMCLHCEKSSKDRPYSGHAEKSIREHIRDVHKIPLEDIKRDARQTFLRSS